MSTPDPKTVREIARKHIRSGRTDIGTTVALHFGRGALSYEEFAAWEYDVHKAWRVELRAVSWPDEQQPADVVTAEQQQDGAAEDVVAFLDAWEADRGFGNAIRGGNGDMPYLFATDLRAVLAERTALAAPAAELTAGQDMCTCNEPRKVCELRTELDRVHAQLNAALAERPEES